MRIATWNINSLRRRMDHVLSVIQRRKIEVLALQEIKAKPDQLVLDALHSEGFEVAALGFNQWNGVAIASKVGLEVVEQQFELPKWGEAGQEIVEARALGALVGTKLQDSKALELWSLYVPNGRELQHDHYFYKLKWLTALKEYGAAKLAADPQAAIIFAGDFNVAPTDADVWDMAYFADKTHVSPAERDAFAALEHAGFKDATRDFLSAPKTFTYWDYKGFKFQKQQGMRIDFMLCSPAVKAQVTGAIIDFEERASEGTSDHAPVIIDVDTAMLKALDNAGGVSHR